MAPKVSTVRPRCTHTVRVRAAVSPSRAKAAIVAPASPAPPPRWRGSWLPAADLPLDEERAATVSFDRRGRCRLTLAVDRPATDADLAALEEAADVLPNLHLFDLDDTGDYPERHAEAFGLSRPLGPDAFNHAGEVELLAPPGGRPPPRRLGRFGVPVVAPGSGAVDGPGPSASPSATLPDRGPGTAGAPRVERALPEGGRPERALLERGRPEGALLERGLLELGRR